MTVLYGIPNCDSVKKARLWLTEHAPHYQFCDFKKTPPSPEHIRQWLTHVPLDKLLNKRGSTWRTLSPEQQAQAQHPDHAVALMSAHPSLIKRPILEHNGTVYCGFDAAAYAACFQAA